MINNRSSGFTLVEALAALTIISIIGVSLLPLFSRTLKFTERLKRENRWNREKIDFERALRKSVSFIVFPFWTTPVIHKEDTGSTEIPFWKGKEKVRLSIGFAGGSLSLTSPENSRTFTGYEEVRISPLLNRRGSTVGITVTVKKRGRKAVTVLCTFGSPGRSVFREEPP